MSEIDIALDSFSKGFEFTKKNYRKFFNEMLKILLFSFVVTIALVAVIMVAVIGLLSVSGDSIAAMVGLVLIMLIVILIASVFGEAIQSVVYNVMDKWGKKVAIIDQTKKNFKPIFFYILAMIVIYMVLLVVPLILMMIVVYGGISEDGGPAAIAASLIGQMAMRVYQMVISIGLAFILQFVLFELIVARTGVINSIKKSYDIVKKTLVPTIIFDIITAALGIVIVIVAIVALLLLLLILGIIAFALYSIAGDTGFWLIIALGIAVLLIFMLALSAAQFTVLLPMQYYYWKAARTVGVGGKTNKKK